ncbi:unnamed protein product [Echinostoma caproni]|uniref:Uncharacterized protein n=1 Tax=Echinostoma caproni TaxID=27848 RepID=A0A3P8L755_9TREM|nr:unnamed protein product [Echinostoma caproni]
MDDKVKAVEWIDFDLDGKGSATFVTGGFDQCAYLWTWDSKSNQVKCVAACRGHSETVMTIASAPSGYKLSTPVFATGSWDGTIKIWSSEALAMIGFQGHTAWLTSVAWAPHRDNQFVTGSVDRSVRLWDTRNLRNSLYDLMGHADMVTDVNWAQATKLTSPTPSGDQCSTKHLILSASADGTVKVYDYPICE